MACEFERKTRLDIKSGICGEHGDEPKSIQFADVVGLNHVSYSHYRFPIARFAATQPAVLNQNQ